MDSSRVKESFFFYMFALNYVNEKLENNLIKRKYVKHQSTKAIAFKLLGPLPKPKQEIENLIKTLKNISRFTFR